MNSSLGSEDDVFDRLRQTIDPNVLKQREKAVQERIQAQYARAQKKLAELIQENSTFPVFIQSIQIDGAIRTRRSFLERVLSPVLSAEKQQSYTLSSVMAELQNTTNTLHRFEIFRPSITLHLDHPTRKLSPGSPTPLDIILRVRERGRLTAKTGTDLSSNDVTGYLNGIYRNAFGGAETLSVTATTGARTRSSFEANLSTPIRSDPDFTISGSAYLSSKSHHYYASFEEVLRGGRANLNYTTKNTRDQYGFTYTGVWRQVTNLPKDASSSVMADAGDSVKSSIGYSFTRDYRDNYLLPSQGYLFRSSSEIALPMLGSDVAFWKNEFDTQASLALFPSKMSVDGSTPPKSPSYLEGIAINLSLRGGLMYPLSAGSPSRINDRFFIGGPNDVRSFRENGIGPKDGNDSLGGDLYLAGGASVTFPLPRVGPEKPFRFHVFINSGRLVAVQQAWNAKKQSDVNQAMIDAVKELTDGLPSTSAGVGLIYAHPMARFELNFGVPLVMRIGERARKGFQFGIGINFL